MLTAERTSTNPFVSARRGLLVDIGIAMITGMGVAIAKLTLDFSLGIPGHSGMSWIAVLIMGAMVNRRPGMTLLAGASVGLWAVPLGLGHSVGYNVALYGLTAGVLEALMRLHLPVHRLLGAMIGGAIAHGVKFGFILGYAFSSGIVKHFTLLGVGPTLLNHVLFGLMGGAVAWAIVNSSREGGQAILKRWRKRVTG